ncbi:MAG TPA: DedA family protein [Crenotrichaceae bacterium]|nr:DedA family protein [Crenotrichaceae bacterium]
MTENWISSQWDLWELFVGSFVSATLAPGGSEILLAYLLGVSEKSSWKLWLVATGGNTLGGISSFVLGALVSRGYLTPEKILADDNHKVLACLHRWGVSVLLLSWLPVVGDTFCVLAGWLRLPMIASVIAMFVGKGLRYAGIVYLQSFVGF